MKDDRWLICPFCGWGKKLKTARQTNTLNRVEPDTGPFIDHRDIQGGRGYGFPRMFFETLGEIKNKEEYQDLISGLKRQCLEVLKVLED